MNNAITRPVGWIRDSIDRNTRRTVNGRSAPDPAALAQLAVALESARNPVLVAGPDIDSSGGWDAAGRTGPVCDGTGPAPIPAGRRCCSCPA